MKPTAQLSDKLRQANALHQTGQLYGARAIYEEILRIQPRHFDALHLLGVVAAQTQDPRRAVKLIDKAIRIDPSNASAHCNKGTALQALKQWDAALACYGRAIALRPDYATAHCNQGIVLGELKRFTTALASYDRAIAVNPDLAEAYSNRGNVLAELGRPDEALESYGRAIAIHSDYAEAWFNQGNLLKKLGRFADALASYDRAIAIRPRYAEAHANRGGVLCELKEWDAAVTGYDRAIALKVDYAEAHYNRGNVLNDAGQLGEALASYDRAIAARSDYAEAHANRGLLLKQLQRHDEALASFGRAIAIKRDLAEAHFNRATLWLLTGDFERGWRDYEWRWAVEPRQDRRAFAQPLWLGAESLVDKTILLHSEQGLGDTLQFCRYAKSVADLGARVVLEVPAALTTLMAGLEGVTHLVTRGEALPAFDYHCPLMSLPLAFNTTLSTIPARAPYLKSPRDKVLYWRDRLGERRKARVGLVWSGGFRADEPEHWSLNARRNVPLAKLAALRHPQVEFYSLQKGQRAESELAELAANGWEGPQLVDFTAELNDFSDTASLMENLDLVISIDSAAAHLAGALRKPLWIMNRFDSCWRWLLDRTDSPWYPSVRLYRQESAGDWDGVAQRLKADLAELAAGEASG